LSANTGGGDAPPGGVIQALSSPASSSRCNAG
jgi:hypothetical protein